MFLQTKTGSIHIQRASLIECEEYFAIKIETKESNPGIVIDFLNPGQDKHKIIILCSDLRPPYDSCSEPTKITITCLSKIKNPKMITSTSEYLIEVVIVEEPLENSLPDIRRNLVIEEER